MTSIASTISSTTHIIDNARYQDRDSHECGEDGKDYNSLIEDNDTYTEITSGECLENDFRVPTR